MDMKKILVINGVNLNMLGIREPNLYGNVTLDGICDMMSKFAEGKLDLTFKQSNYEGEIVEMIQQAYNVYDGIIINAGAYTHTSIAILDALKAVNIPTVEVHLTDVQNREEFRKKSYISIVAKQTIAGKGAEGYIDALKYFLD